VRWILSVSGVVLTTFLVASTAFSAPNGWQSIKTGGNTLCARGAEYSFLYHQGDPNKVVISFGQGGACWDANTCSSKVLFKDTVEFNTGDVEGAQGVYNLANPRNPYYGWTQVMIPYCTADVHLGNADAQYTKDGKTFTIHHRGAVNTKAVLSWLHNRYPTVQELSVAGCSAGSYGSIVWSPLLAEVYKSARMSQYGDSGAGVMPRLFFPQWKVQDSLPYWIPGLDPRRIDWNKLTIVDVYKSAANYYPQIHFSQFNHSRDPIQQLFYSLFGGKPGTWTPQMFRIMDATAAAAPNFNFFVAEGMKHCSMVRDRMYTEQQDGVVLADWLRHSTRGEAVGNVNCRNCSRLANQDTGALEE
jgi:hypothetical protein